MSNYCITGLGYYLPKGRIDNDEMLDRIASANRESLTYEERELLLYSCRRKFDFLGIESRSAPREQDNDTFVTMAVRASQAAIKQANYEDEPIECVITCGISNPFREPSAACIIAHESGLTTVDHFDINDTCNGFLKAIEIAGLYISSGMYRSVLVVTSENPYELERGLGMNITVHSVEEMDYRLSNCIVGAGAAAAVITHGEKGKRILHYQNSKTSDNWDSSCIRIPHTHMPATKYEQPIDGFWADARGMAAELIRENPVFVRKCLEEWGIRPSDIAYAVIHQLGNNIIFAILDKVGIPQEKAPLHTFHEYGNMGSANIPVNLAIAGEKGLVHKDDLILLINSACGYTHSAAIIKW
jgi:3-oxoacyl-[acyl-carrier-protein] synthase III